MISYRIQTRSSGNVLHTVKHGEQIDILEDMECLGMVGEIEMYFENIYHYLTIKRRN